MTHADFLVQINNDEFIDILHNADIVGVKIISPNTFYQSDVLYVIATE